MFYKKDVLRNFTKFTGKHLCQSHRCQQVPESGEACNFIKKEVLAQVFSCEFCKISKNTFFTEHFWTTASVDYYQAKHIQQLEWRKICFYSSNHSFKFRQIWIVPKSIKSVMKVLLEARRTWQQANLFSIINMFPVITETCGGEWYMSS